MIIERRKLTELSPAAYNPRHKQGPGDVEFEKLKASVQAFGNVEPIVWNKRTGNIVGGHLLYEVLRNEGASETDVVTVDLPIEEERLFNIALNRIKGGWDYNKLSEVLSEFDAIEARLSGFGAQEIMLLMADAEAARDNIYAQAETVEAARREAQREEPAEWRGEYPAAHPASGEYVDAGEPGGAFDEGMSYLVTVVFATAAEANEWLEERGIENRIKPGARTVVVRMAGEGA